MRESEVKRRRAGAAARGRKRGSRMKRRRKTVMLRRIAAAVLVLGLIAGGGLLVWNLTPGVKVARQLEAASDYVEDQAYEEALASCEEALRIDSMSVKAYRAMAGVYLNQEDRENAEQVLYQGWETTQDEGLLQEYCVYLLNDAVSDINSESCSFSTLEKCVTAIETDPTSADGYKLLDACYTRLLGENELTLFGETDQEGRNGFDRYLDVMNRLLAVYGANPAEELKARLLRFAVPQSSLVWLDVDKISSYRELLGRVMALGDEGSVSGLDACLEKASWAQDIFAEAFGIFESGNFEPVRDFMQSENYVSIRDQFMDGTMEYWDGKTYIPVSREKIRLMQEEGGWKFSFADFEECPETAGVIKVWSARHADDGVQRLCISYEPASQNGEYFPHTEYEFVYLYSNVKIGNDYVPQMNYRFETRVVTAEGTSSQLIGDWGGEHEWSMEY